MISIKGTVIGTPHSKSNKYPRCHLIEAYAVKNDIIPIYVHREPFKVWDEK